MSVVELAPLWLELLHQFEKELWALPGSASFAWLHVKHLTDGALLGGAGHQ